MCNVCFSFAITYNRKVICLYLTKQSKTHYCWVTLNATTILHSSVYTLIWLKSPQIQKYIQPIYTETILLREAEKINRLGHTARSKEMLALSLAHGSVNSLLGPLAQRGVQGCMEINQQLTSSHHLRSRFDSQDLAGRDTNNPEQTSLNPQVESPQQKM